MLPPLLAVAEESRPRVDAETDLAQAVQDPQVVAAGVSAEISLINKDVQRHAGGLRRLEVAQRTGGQVARVGVFFGQPGVEGGKVGARDIDLAAHGQRPGFGDAQGDLADGAHVVRDVVARQAVAARQGVLQLAAVVVQDNGSAVDLLLDREAGIAIAERGGLLQPLRRLLGLVELVQAEHRHRVRPLGKAVVQVGTDAAARRIGAGILRKALFQQEQLVQQAVILGIADLGAGQDVVQMLVAQQLGGEEFHARTGVHGPIIGKLSLRVNTAPGTVCFSLFSAKLDKCKKYHYYLDSK